MNLSSGYFFDNKEEPAQYGQVFILIGDVQEYQI